MADVKTSDSGRRYVDMDEVVKQRFEQIHRDREWHDAGFKKEAPGLYSRELGKDKKHPLALELAINCAECGHLLNAEVVAEYSKGSQILVTVEKCKCKETEEQPPRQITKEIERIEQRNNHDCLRCCIAMITGIRYEDVPDFCESDSEAWPTACDKWLGEMGYGLLMFGSSAPDFVPAWLPIIAQGSTSISSRYHFVVVTEDKIIDPWPSQPGLTEIKERYAIVNSGSLVNGFIDHLAKRYSEANAALAQSRQQVIKLVEDKRDEWQGKAQTLTTDDDHQWELVVRITAANEILSELKSSIAEKHR